MHNYALLFFLKRFSGNFLKKKEYETVNGEHLRSFLLEIFYVAQLYEW